jgi:putative transposase
VLGAPLIADLVDRATGELEPIRVVTDNGPCYKAGAFARYIRSRPAFEHVRTRHRSPQTNGVIERFYGSIKYEHLYLHEIDDGPALAAQVAGYEQRYNDERPHEAIDWALPAVRYSADPA